MPVLTGVAERRWPVLTGVAERRSPVLTGVAGRWPLQGAAVRTRSLGRGRVRRRDDVTVPRGGSVTLGVGYDPEAFGRFSEAIARYFGTARFLAIQTVIVAGWIVLNSIGLVKHWDPYPFILLNLLFSTQAAYAAPLILLAQNRQDDRDRINIDRDREVAARTQADTEFLARELVAVRLAIAGMATADDLNASLTRLEEMIARLDEQKNAQTPSVAPSEAPG